MGLDSVEQDVRRSVMGPAGEGLLESGAKWRTCLRRQDPNRLGVGRVGGVKTLISSALALVGCVELRPAVADDRVSAEADRPLIQADRWREDWSSLADPDKRTRALDDLKYIPLSGSDPDRYLSFGLTLREIFESSDAPALGTAAASPSDAYWLHRAQFHVDMRLNENWQVFTQVEDVRTFDKKVVGSTDANTLDLRLAFLGYSRSVGSGVLKARVGRQDVAFDLQRFMSSREGPNVRQSFDAIWAGWETPNWRVYGLVSQPVEYRNHRPFDDTSTSDIRFSGIRLERQVSSNAELTGYYALYQRKYASYLDSFGREERQVVDLRFVGFRAPLDWDIEAMGQFGNVGRTGVSAWALGARLGYTPSGTGWPPRIGFQFDVASGDRRAGDGSVGTLNPLFPNGFYFSLGGHTGYSNLVHLKPSLSFNVTAATAVTVGIGALWRQTTNDAVYTLPSIPVAGTAGRGSSWTGAYAQLRADYRFTPALSSSIEVVRYNVGSALRSAGARDSDYVRLETKFSW